MKRQKQLKGLPLKSLAIFRSTDASLLVVANRQAGKGGAALDYLVHPEIEALSAFGPMMCVLHNNAAVHHVQWAVPYVEVALIFTDEGHPCIVEDNVI